MDLRQLIARQALLDLLARYACGVDRCDWALVRSCYHDDAQDDHGLYQGGVDGLMEFLTATAARFASTTHHLGSHLAQIDGDAGGNEARCETQCLCSYQRIGRDGSDRRIAQGLRYLDHMARRDGHWRIARRVVVLDWEQVFEPSPSSTRATTHPGWQRGAHGAADPSFNFFSTPPTGDPA